MEIEELKEMKPAKFGFYYGTICGGISFAFHLLSQWLGFTTNFFYGLIYSFFVLFSLMWVYKKYLTLQEKESGVEFSAFMTIGAIFSLTISFFYLMFTFARIEFLDPNFLNLIAEMSQEMMQQSGMAELSLREGYVTVLVTSFLGDFLGNMFYAFLLALILKNRKF
jgi:hypothetical protein